MEKDLNELINDLELNIEHVKKASMIAKPKQAEIAVESCLKCIKKIAERLEDVRK